MNKLSFILVIFFSFVSFSQTTGDYRTVASGNWDNIAVWEIYDGTSWIAATNYPVYNNSNEVSIQNGHTITIATTLANGSGYIHLTTVQSGGQLTINSGATLYIANDGTSQIDLKVDGTLSNLGTLATNGNCSVQVNGSLINAGTVSVNNSGDVLTFESGSTYQHNRDGGTIPTATWSNGSTCLITGITATAPGGINQSFHHFKWDCAGQTGNVGPNFNDGITITGNFTVSNTGGTSRQYRLTNLSSGQTKTINILGDLIVNGANVLFTGTGSTADSLAKVVINIGGNLNISAGIFNTNNSSNVYGQVNIGGDFIMTGGSFSVNSIRYWRHSIYFNKNNGTQYFSNTGGTIGSITIGVKNNSVLYLNSPITFSATTPGSVDLSNTGKIVTTGSNKITTYGNIIGGNSACYIDGPMASIINSANQTVLNFPIGKGNDYRPILFTITQSASTSTIYTAEMFNTSPAVRTLPTTLDSVSSVRYYNISKNTSVGVSPVDGARIQLNYGLNDFVSDSSVLRIANDDGVGNWVNLGGSGSASGQGTIISNLFYTLNPSTDFVLATVKQGAVVNLPTVSTTSITNISTTTATSGGNITNDGGAAITERGVCWNTTGNPTISDNKTSDGTGAGSFVSSLTGLIPNTKYYYCAYATNSAGTGYGVIDTFTTLAALSVPTVTTSPITNIINTTATSGGNVTFWGGSTVTQRGVCWNTTGNPTIENDFTINGSGTGTFTSQLGGLALGTTYYVRAYATNSTGTGYGNEVIFNTPTPQPDVLKVVAQDGSGDYTTVQAAFNDVPTGYTGKWYIFVKNGVYYEKLLLAAGKVNVVLVGENRDSTILTYDDYSGRVVGGVTIGTSTSYSVAIDAEDFEAQNITFRNTSTVAQAVALRVNGDRQEYYNCNILGYQDTYYTWGGSATGRIYNKNCLIRGSVDFIFGRDIVLFDSCDIQVNRNGGTVTAASTEANFLYGYVFKNCSISSDSIGFDGNPITTFYLGRPWQASPRTVFINTYEPATLNSAGWLAWNVTPALYAEYQCSGPGFVPASRVNWSRQLADTELVNYSMNKIFGKNSSTTSPFSANWMPTMEVPSFPLPIELSGFNGKRINDKVELNWMTITEVQNSGWDVERSIDNIIWKKIGFVKGSGNSNSRQNYKFVDNSFEGMKVFYRLKQYDLDGKISYSNVIEIDLQKSLDYKLYQNYPNPFNPQTKITFEIPQKAHVKLIIYNSLGKEVGRLVDEVLDAGIYNQLFTPVHLPSGVYYGVLSSGEKQLITKMVFLK